jgi:hypothetical protein
MIGCIFKNRMNYAAKKITSLQNMSTILMIDQDKTPGHIS